MREEKGKFGSAQYLPYGRPLECGETIRHEELNPLFPKDFPPINCAWQLFLILGFPFYSWLLAVIGIDYCFHSSWNKYVQDAAMPFEIVGTVFIICFFLVPIIHVMMRNSERIVLTDRRIFFAPSPFARPEFRSVFEPLGDAIGLEVKFKYTLSVYIGKHFNKPCLVFQAYNPNWSISDDDGPVKDYPFPMRDPQSIYDHLPNYLRVPKFVPSSCDGSYEKLKQLCEQELSRRS